MINAPATFYQAMSDGNRNFLYRVEMTLKNRTTLEIENDKIWSRGFEYEDAVSGENDFQIGSAIINKFSLTLNNMSQEFSEHVFEDAEVAVYIGLDAGSGNVRMVRRGSYIVNEANHEDPLITLECYDAMVLFEKSYSESTCDYTNGVPLINILREACETCGVPLDPNISFTNQNLIITTAPDGKSTTFRDVISWIAQIAGCIARINPYGVLEFKQYNLSAMSSVAGGTDGGYFDSDDPYSSGDSVDGGTFNSWNDGDSVDGGTFVDFYDSAKPINYIIDVVSHKVSVNPISFTGLKISYKTGTDSAVDTATYGTSGYVMQIADNQFINSSNVTAIGTSLWNYVQHLAFWKATVSHLANPLIEAGDVAVFWDRNGNKYPIFVTKTSFASGEAQTTICSAQDPARNSSGAVSIATKTYVEVQKIAREAKTARDIMYQTLTEAINSKAGLYMHATTEGGASVFYLHDQEELSQSKLVWKMTANAFAVTNDYNGAHPEQTVWSAGLTVDGTLIAGIMSTIGLDFDWGVGGELTIKKGNTETLYVNADTGVVRINADSVSIGGSTVQDIVNSNTNLLESPFDLTSSYWTHMGTLEAEQSDPDGGNNAVRLIKTSSTGVETNLSSHKTNNKPIKSVGQNYKFSVWLKAQTATTVKLVLNASIIETVSVGTSWKRYTIEGRVDSICSDSQYHQVTVGAWGSWETSGYIYIYNPVVEYADPYMNQQTTYERLTGGNASQGLILQNGQLYVDASYINTGFLSANRIQGGTLTLGGANDINGSLLLLAADRTNIAKLDSSGANFYSGSFKTSNPGVGSALLGSGWLNFEDASGNASGHMGTEIDLSSGAYFGISGDGMNVEIYSTYADMAYSFSILPRQNAYKFRFSDTVRMDSDLWVKGNLQVDGSYPTSSDERLKDIEVWTMPDEFLSEVEPIQFRWNNGQDDKLHYGFGAQSVEKLLQKYGMDDSAIVYYDENQDKYYLNYIEFIPLLVDKVQKLDAENKELKSKLADMESRLERLEKLLWKE